MSKSEYEIFEALNPFFEVVMEGLREFVDGDHYFDTIAEDALFEFRYRFPGWPLTIQGRSVMASLILNLLWAKRRKLPHPENRRVRHPLLSSEPWSSNSNQVYSVEGADAVI